MTLHLCEKEERYYFLYKDESVNILLDAPDYSYYQKHQDYIKN